MEWMTLHVIAAVLTAAAFGGMLFFMTCFAPTVFRTLERAEAARLMRAIFPLYYVTLAIVLAVAGLSLLPAKSYGSELTLLATVVVLFLLLRFLLLPRIDRARDLEDRTTFGRLHRLSVVVNLIQFMAVAVVLVRLLQ
jgi:hypothetical protein